MTQTLYGGNPAWPALAPMVLGAECGLSDRPKCRPFVRFYPVTLSIRHTHSGPWHLRPVAPHELPAGEGEGWDELRAGEG